MKPRYFAVLCAVGLLAAACGDDSSNKSSSTTTPGTSAAAATTAGAGQTSTAGSVDTSKNEASDTGITKDTITIGLITSVTGAASSTFQDTADGVNARFGAENAKGGVNGRKLVLKIADDASTVPGDLTAAQSLVQNDKVFAVIGYSPYLFGGYKYFQQGGIPVRGWGFEGREGRQ